MKAVCAGYADLLEVSFIETSAKELYVYAKFSDGTQGQVDMSELAWMPVFASWKDGEFGKVWLDDGIPCWGEDNHVGPEWMRERLQPMKYEEWKESHRLAAAPVA